MSFLTALKKEFLEQNRTKKTLIAVIVLALFGMTSPLLAKMTPQIVQMVPGGEAFAGMIPTPTVQDAVAQYIKNITQFGILLVFLFAMGAVVSEKEKGTAAMVLSKPMPRGSFLLAKFCAQALTFLIALTLAGLAGYYYTYFLFGETSFAAWTGMNGLLLIYLLIYLAVTIFFSTLTRTQYIALGGSFGVLILLGILGSLPGWTKYLPDGLINNAALLMNGGLISGWQCLWIGLGIIFAALTCGWLIFRRQEF